MKKKHHHIEAARPAAPAIPEVPKTLVIALIIITGFLIYANSLGNDFVYDDKEHVVDNSAIRSPKNIAAIFTHNLTYFGGQQEGKFYRPVETLSFMLNHSLGGANPFGYHLANVILHIIVCVLLFHFLCLIAGDTAVAAAASMLYLAHPVHTEAVAYVSGRADSIVSIFFFAMAILQYRSWSAAGLKRTLYYLGMLAFFTAALLTKESAVIFPVLLVFFGCCLRRKEGYGRLSAAGILYYLPFFVAMAAWFIIKNKIVPTEAMVATQMSVATRLAAAPKALFDYVRIFFMPVGLHMEYRYPFPRTIFQEGYIGPLIFVLAAAPLVYRLWKKGRTDIDHRLIFFGVGWFLIALVPYMNIFFQLNAPFSEHWLYIPAMGLSFAVVYGVFYATKANLAARTAAIGIFIAVTAIFSFATAKQNAVWRDNISFYEYTIRHSPHSAKPYNNLAVEYIKKKDYATALRLLEKAVEIEPRYESASYNLRMLKSQLREE